MQPRRRADLLPPLTPDPVIEAFKKDVDRTLLRENLRLTVEERLATTDTLADLGDSVPHLQDVQFILPAHSGGQATIIITGSDETPATRRHRVSQKYVLNIIDGVHRGG